MARQLVVEILSDAKKFDRGFDQAERRLGQFDSRTKKATDTTSKFGGRLDAARVSLASMAKVAAGAVAVKFLTDSVSAASNLAETVNAVEKVFGDASDTVLNFGEVSAQVAGLSSREFNQLATQTGALLTNMGFSFEDAANQSIKLTTRAADLASVFNTDVATALEAVNSGLRGETEPLRRFGVQLSDAAIRTKAVELGLADTTAAVDANGKAVAALELIYEQTSAAQGDFLQTSDSVANSLRIAQAQWEDAQASFGQSALPVAATALNVLSEGLLRTRGFFDENAAAQDRFGIATRNVVATLRDGGDAFSTLADSLLFLAEEGELTVGQFQALAATAGLTSDQFERFGEIVVDQARAMGVSEEVIAELQDAILGTGAAAEEAAPGMEELADETGKAGDEARETTTSFKDLTSEIRAQTSPVFSALRAWQSYQETIAQIDEDGERTADELVNLAEAAIDVVGAFGELSDQNLAQVFETIGSAIGASADEAEALFRELGLFDGRTFTYSVVEQRSSITSSGFSSDSGVRGFGGGRAAGGPVSGDMAYLVGERGPELFFPPSSGVILDAFATRSMLSGGDQNITVNVMSEAQAAQVASIMAANRALVRGGLPGGAR